MNTIIISKDFEKTRQRLEAEYENAYFYVSSKAPFDFILGEKKNEANPCNAREVLRQSYISESSLKVLVIMANSFKIEAQNFLLKSFEEPPSNIKFILVSPSLNLLLPTVKSRFLVEKENFVKRERREFDTKKLDLRSIYQLVVENERADKEKLSMLISDLLYSSLQDKLSLNEDDLELFYKSSELAKVNARPYACLLAVLLTIYERD